MRNQQRSVLPSASRARSRQCHWPAVNAEHITASVTLCVGRESIWRTSRNDLIFARGACRHRLDIIFFGSEDGKMYAVNPSDRQLLWVFETGSKAQNVDGGEIVAAPAVSADGKVGSETVFDLIESNASCASSSRGLSSWCEGRSKIATIEPEILLLLAAARGGAAVMPPLHCRYIMTYMCTRSAASP